MDQRLTERLFEELDKNTKRVEDMSKIVYENSATLTLMVRLVIGIILFLIAFTIGIIGDNLSSEKKQQVMTKNTVNTLMEKQSLVMQEKIMSKIQKELEEHNQREVKFLKELTKTVGEKNEKNEKNKVCDMPKEVP